MVKLIYKLFLEMIFLKLFLGMFSYVIFLLNKNIFLIENIVVYVSFIYG